MENLTPVQRVAAIAIGLALTLLLVLFLLPWAWDQVSEWLPASETRGIGLVPAPLPDWVSPTAKAPETTTSAWAGTHAVGMHAGTQELSAGLL